MEQHAGGRSPGRRDVSSGNGKPNDYGAPPIAACRLWVKTSAKGVRYLTGRLGGLRVLVMPNRERNGEDDASHVLLIAAAPPSKPREAAE